MSIRSITNAKNTKVGIRNKSQHPTRTILQRISWIYPEDVVILTLQPERYLKNSSSEAVKKLAMELLICEFTGLNTNPNGAGFDERRKAGKIAGNNLLTKMKMDKAIFKNKYGVNADTLDIVCHSMGYAYALGMIDVLNDYVTFGRFYIIAPENAESGGADWNMFTEVWQYGSNEETLKNTPKLQDGVAPQTNAKDLPKGRRAFIPDDVPQGFLKSHSIGNYGWIFTNEGRAGYVKQRK